MNIGRTLGMAVACMFIAGSTSVFAEDAGQVATPQTANTQVASVDPLAIPAQQKPGMDPLHADARWPQFKNCIDNTVTPAAFQACLQMAFLGAAPTGQVLALLTH
jgi:hypothetical protein